VVVENRVGATGTIGADAVAKSAPDGHTLLFTPDLPIAMAPALFKTPYDPKTDLLPVAAVGAGINALFAHPSAGANTLAELVEAARRKPGALTFSSAGNGSPAHLCGEMLKKAAGIDLTHVPYKGAAPAMTALLAGEVSLFCGPIPTGLAHVRTGKLKALATTGASPAAQMPEVKPLTETYSGVTVTTWQALFAPGKTPAALAAAIRSDLRRVFDDADTKVRLAAAGVDSAWMDDRQLAATIDRDLAKWTRVVRELNIKVD
jgi:tripartite-type tricarboxylate transporter receptor subunit TctC